MHIFLPHVQIEFLKFSSCDNQALVGCIPVADVAVHFKPEIIKIGRSSHKMDSNNIQNFQESTTILNAHTKKVWKPIECTQLFIFCNREVHAFSERNSSKVNVIAQLEFELAYYDVEVTPKPYQRGQFSCCVATFNRVVN